MGYHRSVYAGTFMRNHNWNMYMKTCISVLMDQEKKKIGGESMIVEIDESLFTKRKNNAGRVLLEQ